MIHSINLFEVPEGHEDEFFTMFLEVNEHMAAQPGYLGHRMHRSVGSDAKYRFVNYVQWASVEDLRAAHDDTFRALVSRPEWRDFVATPAVYELVHERTAA